MSQKNDSNDGCLVVVLVLILLFVWSIEQKVATKTPESKPEVQDARTMEKIP